MDKIIDGKKIAEVIREEVRGEVLKLKEKGVIPNLSVVLVGESSASLVYVRNKEKACVEAGIIFDLVKLSESVTQEELLQKVAELNTDEKVHGILVQLPLPAQIDEQKIIEVIDPKKDVDGFHRENIGKMFLGADGLLPCTPAGIVELLKKSQVEISGKRCVIVGRSNIVGKPLALLLLREDATVTVCHSRTRNLEEICREADILISAVGKSDMIGEGFVKEGAVVIDVGINRNEEGKLRGDVDFEKVLPKVSKITPVPGGVGPMTIAMLLGNVVRACNDLKRGD
ncbi:MAG: bifunctional methylenetetrahydrofolate dehydrogenase/methenyltetrahydrofolate cyclohydrolase FolD [Patescibacteria group bacterium]